MSTLPVAPRIQHSPGHVWFTEHLPELTPHAKLFAARFRRRERDEAVAEILGQVLRYCLSAARRGKLHLLTPYTLVSFFGRGYAAGRRLCGTHSADVLTRAANPRHGLRVVSLNECRWVRTVDGPAWLPLSEVLADRRAPDPFESCRQDLDYPGILRRQRASRKARRVFAWLAASHGGASGVDMARRLRVSPPRIVQLKQELAGHLAVEGYAPSGPRPVLKSRRGRPRRYAPPLNAGTSPPQQIGDNREPRLPRHARPRIAALAGAAT